MKPVHPGEMLREEFMKPLKLTMNRLAIDLRVPVTRIGDIVHERRGITADTALRLARYFKNTPEFWMNLQTWYDLEVAKDEREVQINRDVTPLERSHTVLLPVLLPLAFAAKPKSKQFPRWNMPQPAAVPRGQYLRNSDTRHEEAIPFEGAEKHRRWLSHLR